jgi:hyperosmotically inducible periplasmic protein
MRKISAKFFVTVCIAVATPLLLGCVAAAIGGAAAGGYYVGKDKRTTSQIAVDGAITAEVKTKLIADTEVKALDINVDTYENVVILRGEVATAEQRAQAERVARSIGRVKAVRNELRVR